MDMNKAKLLNEIKFKVETSISPDTMSFSFFLHLLNTTDMLIER